MNSIVIMLRLVGKRSWLFHVFTKQLDLESPWLDDSERNKNHHQAINEREEACGKYVTEHDVIAGMSLDPGTRFVHVCICWLYVDRRSWDGYVLESGHLGALLGGNLFYNVTLYLCMCMLTCLYI